MRAKSPIHLLELGVALWVTETRRGRTCAHLRVELGGGQCAPALQGGQEIPGSGTVPTSFTTPHRYLATTQVLQKQLLKERTQSKLLAVVDDADRPEPGRGGGE